MHLLMYTLVKRHQEHLLDGCGGKEPMAFARGGCPAKGTQPLAPLEAVVAALLLARAPATTLEADVAVQALVCAARPAVCWRTALAHALLLSDLWRCSECCE